jgi:tetratricopeptide (TPR) repeat protein
MAINIEGRNYSHYLNMGTIHLYLNDRKSALSSFKKSMSLYPQYPKLYLYAGELAFRDGMDSEALRIVEKGIFLEKILLSAENNEIIDIIELYRLKILVLKKYGMLNEVDKTKKDALSLGEIIRSKGLIERRTSRGRSVREALEEIRNM